MAEDTSESRPKRRLKSPDTFRDRAEKADIASKQPKKRGRIGRVIAAPFKFVGRGIKMSFLWPVLSLVGRILRRIFKFIIPPFFRSSWSELKLVTWPNWQQSRKLTSAVLIFAIVFGATIAVVDYGLDNLFKHILLK